MGSFGSAAPGCTTTRMVNGKKVIVVHNQHWKDADFNGVGQLPGDGNILGR